MKRNRPGAVGTVESALYSYTAAHPLLSIDRAPGNRRMSLESPYFWTALNSGGAMICASTCHLFSEPPHSVCSNDMTPLPALEWISESRKIVMIDLVFLPALPTYLCPTSESMSRFRPCIHFCVKGKVQLGPASTSGDGTRRDVTLLSKTKKPPALVPMAPTFSMLLWYHCTRDFFAPCDPGQSRRF